ncbi:MAG: LysM peptidoglycan-binding domain-containing protein [Chloroflexi bacterium]|nr:MAG: LysM peptidoglycan-binding domain-containing protein [Chloroflexota bacterium]
MNDNFTNTNRDEEIVQKINQVAEGTNVNLQFAAELEERLRSAHSPKTSRFVASFKQVSPALRWVALMVLLGLVLSLSIKTLIPAPQPAADNTPTSPDASPTPVPQGETFDYDGAQLIMNVPFPDSAGQANVYSVLDAQPATAEFAQTLAGQFDIEGEVYVTQGRDSEDSALMVTDGKQQLVIYAQNDYVYTSDIRKYSRMYTGFPHENAEAIIREYMSSHGFDFEFSFETSSLSSEYVLRQLSPDGLPMTTDSHGDTRVALDEDGSILNLQMSVIEYEPAALGSFGMITAKEAVQQLVDETDYGGSIQSGGSMPDPNLAPPQHWYYEYPDDQTITVYGNVTSYRGADPNTSAIVFIDNVPVAGNTSGMETLEDFAFVQATGEFVVENDVRKLNVEAWDQDVQKTCTSGSAHRDGEQIIITNQTEPVSEYTLVAPPTDLPLDTPFPDSQLHSCGVAIDGQLHWIDIHYFPDSSQMGGGGGGGGFFYQLNLSGTPVPFSTASQPETTQPPFDYTVVAGDTCASIGMAFGVSIKSIVTLNNLSTDCIIRVGQVLKIPYPMPAPGQSSAYSSAELSAFPIYIVQPDDTLAKIAEMYNVSPKEIMQANSMPDATVVTDSALIIPVTRLEGERGIVEVRIYAKPDGQQRTSYTFATERDQTYFELKGNNLEALQATMNRPIKLWGNLSVDEKGMAFITVEKFEPLYPDLQFQILTGTQEIKEIDGAQAILFTTGGTTYIQLRPDGGYPDYSYYPDDEEVILESLQVPDETYAGYPAIRVFQMAPAFDAGTGKPIELPGVANIIEVMPDPFGNADAYVPPNTIIEKVELMYFATDPASYDQSLEPGEVYLQPVWYLQGHNDNGDEVNIYVQALRQEYLLPQTEP